MDIEYEYPFGWKEMFGIAYRTDFDLANHSKHSGKDYDQVWKDSDRDYWMIAQEAKEYGMVDEVLGKNQ